MLIQPLALRQVPRIAGGNPETVTSDLICGANHEIYLDGSEKPQLEYLGTEDCYGKLP